MNNSSSRREKSISSSQSTNSSLATQQSSSSSISYKNDVEKRSPASNASQSKIYCRPSTLNGRDCNQSIDSTFTTKVSNHQNLSGSKLPILNLPKPDSQFTDLFGPPIQTGPNGNRIVCDERISMIKAKPNVSFFQISNFLNNHRIIHWYISYIFNITFLLSNLKILQHIYQSTQWYTIVFDFQLKPHAPNQRRMSDSDSLLRHRNWDPFLILLVQIFYHRFYFLACCFQV